MTNLTVGTSIIQESYHAAATTIAEMVVHGGIVPGISTKEPQHKVLVVAWQQLMLVQIDGSDDG